MYDQTVTQTQDSVSHPDPSTGPRYIQGVASPGLHGVLLWSERLSRLSPIVIGLYFGLLTLLVAIVWATVNDSIVTGAIVGIAFLFFVALDWLMLAALPWRKRSYGPVSPGLMAFTTARSIITIIAALIPLSPLWTATLVEIGNFALTGYGLNSLWGEPFRLGVTKITLKSPKLRGAPPLRVLHLSDLHIERMTPRETKLLKMIGELRPDVIVCTGDLINFSYIEDQRARTECRELLSKIHAPLGVYAVPGTPLIDTPEVLKAVYDGLDHITLLTNQTCSLEGYPQVEIIGVSCTHNPSLDGPQFDRLRAEVSAEKYLLLLHHSPDLMPAAAQSKIDLYVCGHTHGGQLRLPLIGALLTGSIYGKRYEMGRYQEGVTTLYISRGIGLEGKGMPRMRFLCPPEIELFELRGTDER